MRGTISPGECPALYRLVAEGPADLALALRRSNEERRSLEDRLFVAAMTDPLTRLTNRDAFTRMLHHLAEARVRGHLALFDLDHFRSINLRHGHSGGDRVLVATARLMRALLGPDDIISRIGGGSFGVLLPDSDEVRARSGCGLPSGLRLTASAGLARIAGSADMALRSAELALLAAKSHGRSRVECTRTKPSKWSLDRRCH
jgi:GGDEF domain-containing protein